MIQYKKQKYNDIRSALADNVFVNLLRETLRVNKVEVAEDETRRIFVSLLAAMSYYLYEHPEYYIDLNKMVIYRDTNLKNLITIEAKEGENAKSIMDFYKNGGAFSEELEKLVKAFVQGMLEYSQNKEVEITKEISNIKEAQKANVNKTNRRNKDGI